MRMGLGLSLGLGAGAGVAAPVVTSVDIDLGDPVGGDARTLTGANFLGATAVTVDATSATFLVLSATEILLITPAHAAGATTISVTGPGGTSPTVAFEYWSPASLALTGFWDRGNYQDATAGTWPGRASAGSSAGRDIAQVTASKQPAEVNLEPDLDGVNDYLTSGAVAADTLISKPAYTIRAIVRLDTVAAPGNVWQEAAIWTESAATLCLTVTSDGVRVGHYDTAFHVTTAVPLAVGKLALVQAWYDGAHFRCSVDDALSNSVAANQLGWGAAGGVYFGCTYDTTTKFVDGAIRHISTMQSDDSANNAKYLKWARASRGLA